MAPSPTPARDEPARDEEATRRFVESFALALTTAGMQRMAARVFTVLLAAEQGSKTAGELAEELQISPAAVSGAVRYLTQVDMVQKAREPGERRDHYMIGDEFWYEAVSRKDSLYQHFADRLDEGIEAVGRGTEAGSRIADTRDFFTYLAKEMPVLIDRWREERHNRP